MLAARGILSELRQVECMAAFGNWLRQQRKRHDLTQAELAQQAGCAIGTLRNIEIDRARPSKQLAARLVKALGVADADVAALVAFARDTAPLPVGLAAPDRVPPALPEPALGAAAQRAGTLAARSSLPAPLTGLIGREQAIDTIRILLLRPDVRLVTLTGPGGIGKTRLAVASALQVQAAFADGVCYVDLSAIHNPALVLPTIAQSLGFTNSGGQPLGHYLAAVLRERAVLLLLDNFEQVVAAAPHVFELLAACPLLKVLTTSRIVLGVTGEYAWSVPPLALPDRAQLPPFTQLRQYEALRLFGERARATDQSFAISVSNAPAVAEICHQLDGVPLAIELAAARVKLFAPQALLARLDRRLSFLTGGRERPLRQQTLRTTIDWSYQLLTASEQTLFERLGVFVNIPPAHAGGLHLTPTPTASRWTRLAG
jgi:transcriptional regulator with XRE-family HTH domain